MSAQPWPRWVRYPIVVLVGAFVLIGLVVAAYDRGWLPIAGPFVAAVVASVIVYFVAAWRNRRLRTHSEQARNQLLDLQISLQRERDLPQAERPTGADDASLRAAVQHVEQALQRLAWGHEQGAVTPVEQLGQTARTWRVEAPLTQAVGELGATTARMDETARRMLEDHERRTRGKGRGKDLG